MYNRSVSLHGGSSSRQSWMGRGIPDPAWAPPGVLWVLKQGWKFGGYCPQSPPVSSFKRPFQKGFYDDFLFAGQGKQKGSAPHQDGKGNRSGCSSAGPLEKSPKGKRRKFPHLSGKGEINLGAMRPKRSGWGSAGAAQRRVRAQGGAGAELRPQTGAVGHRLVLLC